MRKDIKNGIKRILGLSSVYIIEHKILNAVTVVVMLATLLSISLNYISGLPIITVYGSIVITICFALLFFYSIKSKNFVSYYYLVFSFLIIVFGPFFWIVNAGSLGPTPYFYILIIVWANITSRNYSYLYFSILSLFAIIVLLGMEYKFPQLIIGYQKNEDRLSDIFFSSFLVAILTVVSLRVFMKIYRNAIKKEIEQKKELQEKNMEIMAQRNELTKLNSDKDRFIAILAHDLRGPFNGFMGLSELLKNNISLYDQKKIESMAILINKSARNSYNLLEDLLKWTQSGKLPYGPQQLNLTNICAGIIETINPLAGEKNIALNNFVAEGITIFADVNMLKTVLRNLISNAIKFTKSGGKINIYSAQDQLNITITVSDNGVGIDIETLNKLFDISQKFTLKGTANEKGSGLGLLLCKEFVEKHGGKIWAESEEGKGSHFKFSLPLFNG